MATSMRDEPGTQREYETIFILRPDTNQDGITAVNARIRSVIEQMGGKILRLDNWGKRKLAYEIKKQLKGIYLYWQYLGTSGIVEEIERNLRMLDSVIRYYTVKIDEDVDPNARPTTVDEETFVKAASTVPDEEELVTGAAMPRFRDDEDADVDEDYDPDLDDIDLDKPEE
ncbi:MAG: 30S ribosomal protein S6 [Myxococcales bacterium]|nr:30S ribosomal protein S6 [Myxococcota bacterium]MDW8284208.1 30S ribosomal protein S6 [Myxococcales bacterium]